jgi:hypothetical protein
MGFLNILYITGLSLVIIPIILHLFKRRTEVVVNFPAIKYLIRAQQRFRKSIVLTDMFLMLLRAGAIILLSIAVSQPYTGNPSVEIARKYENTAVLIDTSMSMCADGFLKKAKSIATEIINEYSPQVLIATFNDSIDSYKKGSEKDIINGLKCSYKSTDIYRAITETADILGDGEKFIYLITDMRNNGWDAGKIATMLEKKQVNLIIVDVAKDLQPKNYYVRDFRAEEIPEGTKINFWIASTSESDQEVQVSLKLEDSTELSTVTKPGKNLEFTIQKGHSGEGYIEISGDELQEDNRYFFFLDIKKKPGILIVDGEPDIRPFRGESYFLLRAIEALKEKFQAEVSVVTPSMLADIKTLNYDIFFILNVSQIPKNTMETIMTQVNRGAGLFFAFGDNIDINWFKITLADKIGIVPGVIQSGEFHSGSMPAEDFFFNFSKEKKLREEILFRKRVVFIPEDSELAKTVLFFKDGAPALIESVPGSGVVLVFASTLDSEWTNLPLSGLFVPFVHDVLMKLSSGGKQVIVKNLLTGRQNIVPDKDFNKISLISPDGKERVIRALNNVIQADLDIPGIWRLGDNLLIVNTDPQESDMKRVDNEELKKITGRRVTFWGGVTKRGAESTFKPLWQYFIMTLALIIVIESFLSGRKR